MRKQIEKPFIQKPILTLACGLALTTTALQAQTISSRLQPLSVAPTTTEVGARGGAGSDAPDQEAELAKKLNNPVASLISVPFQNNWDFGIGPAHAMKYTCNIQPVIPISISKDWNLIVRTILPVIYQETLDDNPKAPESIGKAHGGLGDTTQSFFFSSKNPVGGWILGAGPVGYYPTATSDYLGGGKWGAGPTIVALRQEYGFTYGILANQIWSFAGQQDRQNINASYLQPFVAYTTKTYTTFAINSESTYDWQSDQATVPMNFMVQQLIKIGKMPVAFQAGYRYYVNKPDEGPDWGLRFTITLLFPK